MSWGAIAVGTRMNDRCDPVFFNCWSHLLARGLRPGDTLLDAAVELSQHYAATVMAKFFLRSDADTLCMVDTDMIFKPDTLTRLRDDPQGWDYDILSALSVTRRKPFYPILLRLKEESEKTPQCAFESMVNSIDGSVIAADSVGTGFTLIRRRVFDLMREKMGIERWFFEFGPEGQGEDTNFCLRARELGLKIGVHTGVSIGHRGPLTFYWDAEKKMAMLESHDQAKEIITA